MMERCLAKQCDGGSFPGPRISSIGDSHNAYGPGNVRGTGTERIIENQRKPAMFKEFKAFLTASNALALAIGVIIGAATGKVVSAIVDDLLMPIIGLVLPAGNWKEAKIVLKSAADASGKVTESSIAYGHLIGTAIDFIIIAFIVFLITKALLKPAPAPPATKTCPECLESIPVAAKRCRACTSAVA